MARRQEEPKKQKSQQTGKLTSKVKRISGSHHCQKPHEPKRVGLRKKTWELLIIKTAVRICGGDRPVRGYRGNEKAQENTWSSSNSFKKLGNKGNGRARWGEGWAEWPRAGYLEPKCLSLWTKCYHLLAVSVRQVTCPLCTSFPTYKIGHSNRIYLMYLVWALNEVMNAKYVALHVVQVRSDLRY